MEMTLQSTEHVRKPSNRRQAIAIGAVVGLVVAVLSVSLLFSERIETQWLGLVFSIVAYLASGFIAGLRSNEPQRSARAKAGLTAGLTTAVIDAVASIIILYIAYATGLSHDRFVAQMRQMPAEQVAAFQRSGMSIEQTLRFSLIAGSVCSGILYPVLGIALGALSGALSPLRRDRP